MAYATAQDMVTRFGQAEMLRLTAPEGAPLDVIDFSRLNLVLADASAIMDSYLRRRYLTPVSPVPQELARACCVLARHELAQGEGRQPTEQMKIGQDAVMKWLHEIYDGRALLSDGTPAGDESYAQIAVRGNPSGQATPMFGPGSECGGPGAGFYPSWPQEQL